MKPRLFNFGDFTLASGKKANFKFDLDALTNDDVEDLARRVAASAFATVFGPFRAVEGVPRGGLRFAFFLRKYLPVTPGGKVLIADDVLTTGGSMNKLRVALGLSNEEVVGLAVVDRSLARPVWAHGVLRDDPLFDPVH